MTVQLVVLDMAGTTVYDGDAVNVCLCAALHGADVEVTRDAVNAVMGIAKPVAIRSLLEAQASDPAMVTAADRVAKVGDTPSDLQEGHAAGCGRIIGVTAGSHTHAELSPYPHTHLIGTVAELLPCLA